MSFIKKQGVCGWIVVAAVILALVSMIMYIVNSNTGYMEGMGMNALPVVFTVIFIIGAVIVLALSDKMNESLSGLLLFVLAQVTCSTPSTIRMRKSKPCARRSPAFRST